MNLKKLLSKNKALLSVSALMLSFSNVHGAITVAEKDGWKADLTGAVNAYMMYNTPSGAGKEDAFRIRSGFNPSQIGFNVMAPDWNGKKIMSRIAFYPSIQSDNAKSGEPALQLRESFFKISGDTGSFLLGRTLSIFQRQQIIFDQSGLGVGATSESGAGNSTTAGMIGYGYQYTDFNAGVTYMTPDMGGFSLALGLYDPADIGQNGSGTAVAATLKAPRIEFESVYNMSFSGATSLKVYLSGLYQKAEVSTAYGTKSVGNSVTSKGLSAGFIFAMDQFRVGASGYSGQALGMSGNLGGSDVLNTSGKETSSSGYHVQAVQGIGSFEVGVGHGRSRVTGKENTGLQVLVAYHATENLKFNTEFGQFEDKTGKTKTADYSSYNFGATFSF